MNNENIKNEVNNDANKTMASNEEMKKEKNDKRDLSNLNNNKNNSGTNIINIRTSSNNINNNDNNNNSINDTYLKQFGRKPITIECRFCKKKIKTIIHKEYNWGLFCFNFWTFGLSHRQNNKENNSLLIRHQCPYCGNLLCEKKYRC